LKLAPAAKGCERTGKDHL